MNEVQGWINLYKPKNISSFKAINKVKTKFSINKIGHAGTLDPAAEGILPIALGKATKLIPYVTNSSKIYKFTINWGTQTSTDDSEGFVTHKSKILPKLEDIEKKIKKLSGYIDQVPPKVSAVKINGQRAYMLSKKNINFSITPRKVFVKNVKIINHQFSKTSFKLECGKGFYIRSFARDLARDLKTFGHISTLERIKVGKFTKESSILLDDLLKIVQRHSEINCIKTTISMLDDILAYEIIDKENLKDLSLGRSIKLDALTLNKSQHNSSDKKLVFLSKNGDIVSIGKLIGNLFKPQKVLI